MQKTTTILGVACMLAFAPLWSAAADQEATTANEVLTKAHDGRASWDGMPGFQATMTVFAEGKRQQGELHVSADGKMELTGVKFENQQLVDGALRSLVGHRFADGEPQTGVFADDATDNPLGRLIKLDDDGQMASQFRVEGDVTREVIRSGKTGSFTITVLDVYRNADGKHLPGCYTVSFWDTNGNLTSSSVVRDTWTRVGQWDLPQSYLAVRVGAEGKRDVVQIDFTDHQLAAQQ